MAAVHTRTRADCCQLSPSADETKASRRSWPYVSYTSRRDRTNHMKSNAFEDAPRHANTHFSAAQRKSHKEKDAACVCGVLMCGVARSAPAVIHT